MLVGLDEIHDSWQIFCNKITNRKPQTMKPGFFVTTTVAFAFLSACNNPSSPPSSSTDTATSAGDSTMKETAKTASLREENVSYTANGVTMHGYLVYDANKEGKRPAVL